MPPESLSCNIHYASFLCIPQLANFSINREPLYIHSVRQTWRLIGTSILMAMLAIASIPTISFEWADLANFDQDSPINHAISNPAEPAICHYERNHSKLLPLTRLFFTGPALFLIVAFLIKVMKLYPAISVNTFGRIRASCSGFARSQLKRVYKWQDTNEDSWRFRRLLVYRPLLCAFLLFRALADLGCSFLLEVWWLSFAFIWTTDRDPLFKTKTSMSKPK
ncbi:hypothetical protein BT63DRAFT_185545 [Microthyrium microscopicum]|uniref:Uncharacterized protein n=1 Tax=Microthyrium microscopicum TaxID=703497 RepID=A0A6A6UIG8_9PEZI|nr:hypothetical protein BT63DRAFT_185545 [Microthyrium microscopicum]